MAVRSAAGTGAPHPQYRSRALPLVYLFLAGLAIFCVVPS